MLNKPRIPVPDAQRERLEAIGRRFGFSSAAAFAHHLIERGLRALMAGEDARPLAARLQITAEEEGYSSAEELAEHLIERGLRAYDVPETDRAKLEARLRGLGYVD